MTVSTISTGLVITASDVLILGRSKILTATRAWPAASGDVAYTGAGFQPRTVIAFTEQPSWGFADQSLAERDISFRPSQATPSPEVWADAESYLITLYMGSTTTYFQKAALKSLDTDGFTLNWDSASISANVSMDIAFLCLG